MPEGDFSADQLAKGEEVTAYYKNLKQDGPIPPDETKTHFIRDLRDIIDTAQPSPVAGESREAFPEIDK